MAQAEDRARESQKKSARTHARMQELEAEQAHRRASLSSFLRGVKHEIQQQAHARIGCLLQDVAAVLGDVEETVEMARTSAREEEKVRARLAEVEEREVRREEEYACVLWRLGKVREDGMARVSAIVSGSCEVQTIVEELVRAPNAVECSTGLRGERGESSQKKCEEEEGEGSMVAQERGDEEVGEGGKETGGSGRRWRLESVAECRDTCEDVLIQDTWHVIDVLAHALSSLAPIYRARQEELQMEQAAVLGNHERALRCAYEMLVLAQQRADAEARLLHARLQQARARCEELQVQISDARSGHEDALLHLQRARGLQSTLQRWLSRRGLQEVARASLGAWRSYAERLARSMRMEEHVRVQRGLQIYADVLLCWLVPPSVSPLPQALLV